MIFNTQNNSKQKVSANAFFYFFYQCILFVAPLIILPYLTRVLSDSSLGQYNFSYSIAYFFVLAANLGISTYGQREIASYKSDKEMLAKKYWSLFAVHLFFSFISICCYLLFTFFNKETALYACLIPYVLSALFDVTWFFYGLENFKLVTLINAFFSIVKVILLFVFVKNSNHLWVYQLITFGTTFLIQLIIFLFSIKTVGKPVRIKLSDCLLHVKPILYFALSIVALSLYTNFDKTLMGLFINDGKRSVAYYEYADKIVAVPRMLITVLSTVLYPRICALTKESKKEEVSFYTSFSISWVCFFSFGSIFGIISLAVPFSVLYYGDIYKISGFAMMMMSPLIFIISLGSICRTQYLLPNKKDKVFLLAIIMNAIINVVLNLLLIKPLGIYGVIIASIISESLALFYQMFHSRKHIAIKKLICTASLYALAGFIMFVFLNGLTKLVLVNNWLSLVVLVLFGIAFYTVLSIIFCNTSNQFNFLQRFFKRKNK